MKNLIKILFFVISLFFLNISKADDAAGDGRIQLTEDMVEYFKLYLSNKGGQAFPASLYVTIDGTNGVYWTCPIAQCNPGSTKTMSRECSSITGQKCKLFAKKRTVKWKNGINPGKGKASKFSKKMSDQELRDKLNKLGFYNNSSLDSSSYNNSTEQNNDSSTVNNSYSLKGERAIALSWKGYSDLIAGIIDFDEKNYKGNINLDLPNNDGSCEGNYMLQKGGKGTWQLSCSNDMGASGTLKWIKDGSVTGKGLDFNDNKVTFTVSSKS